jgi:hypothetical protein
MLPSPSLAPPWLSLSLSPAFGPWGIPEELEPELVDVAAGADEELDDFEEEPPPHPATAIAAVTRASPNHRRVVSQFMCSPRFTPIDCARLGFLPARGARVGAARLRVST